MTVLEREISWRQQNDAFDFYQPNLPISQLIELVGTRQNLLYILSAANGIGKTVALVNIARALMFGPSNRFFNFPLFKEWPYPKRIRFVSEVSQVKDGGPLQTEIQKWWPRGKYKSRRNGGVHYDSLYEANGWAFEVMTYDQLPKQHEGANLGCVMFNEPPPENLWTPNISRLRAGGIGIVGMTPLTEAGWFFDKVAPRHQDYTIYADVETACIQHGTRGHLEHEHIQKMISEYDDDEKEARIEGRAMYLKGLIYKTFNSKVHVLSEVVTPPSNATIYHVVDPHTDKPFASIWAFVDGRGDVTIFDEWPNSDFNAWRNCQTSLPEYKQIFLAKEKGLYVHKRIIDRHFAEVTHLSGMTRKTLRDEFSDIGINFMPSYQAREEVETGILKVKSYLKYDPDRPIDIVNKPKLFINPHCQNTIKSFLRWSYDPKTDEPQDAFKDFADTVRYLLMDHPEIDVPIPYEPAKKMW